MKAAFTICTSSYLAQAKVLSQSFIKFAGDYKFYLFLVDELDEQIEYNKFEGVEFVLAKTLPIDFFALVEKYNIIELNTCIKGTCFKYLFNKGAQMVHYFDPDIELLDEIKHLDAHFKDAPILLTPHITSPITWQDGSPNENLFLNHGLYNLGYKGLTNQGDYMKLLDWWEDRTLTRGYYRTKQGFFVDQLWINYVPLFWPESTKILFDPGYNMGPWNLHERTLSSQEGGKFLVNNVSTLKFYHFSSYKHINHEISNNYRYTFATNPDVKLLYDSYQKKMIEAGVDFYLSIKWAYQKKETFIKRLFKKKK